MAAVKEPQGKQDSGTLAPSKHPARHTNIRRLRPVLFDWLVESTWKLSTAA